jgi:type III secretion protein V
MTPAAFLSPLSAANPRRYADLALAALVVSVIVMMALPLPPWTLDILVGTNLCGGIVLLLIALFVPTPLAFSTFPAVLLITTLFRISLSVATTRQILLHSHGGDIIDAFGRMVVGGSLVVGLVIFLIITVVQFIVVAKGAERVAEVGARFTLDALPGKQMSIDADLRAGVLSQTQALARRQELVHESHFYGAMDGAMKFVKGDAIAGIIIVAVNLLGGITIGTLSMGMPLSEAITRFCILSIGDGLVTQIPALFVSIAAGITITRTAPDGAANLGEQIGSQLGAQPRALMLGAGVTFLFALVPGFPALTFLAMAALIAALSYRLSRQHRASLAQRQQTEIPAAAREGETAPVLLQTAADPSASPPSPFSLELSPSLMARIPAPALNLALQQERHQLLTHYGIPFPGLSLRSNPAMPENGFAILVQDLPELSLTIPPNAVLLLGQFNPVSIGTFPAAPEWLLPAQWIAQDHTMISKKDAPASEALSPAQAIARLVMRAIQRHPAAALGLQAVRQRIRDIEWRYGDLAREALSLMPIGRLADLMVTLARERVPMTDLPGLLQAVVTHAPGAPTTHALYESIRLALSRSIVARLLPTPNSPEPLTAITLSPAWETHLRAALLEPADGPILALPPADMAAFLSATLAAFEAAAATQTQVLALPFDLRRATSRLLRTPFPRAAFLSHEELTQAGIQARLVGRVQ